MEIKDDLIIRDREDAESFAGVTSVGGSLNVRAEFQAPALTSVGGYLNVRAEFQAPALTSVGGTFNVLAEFQAPALEAVKLAEHECFQLWFHDGTYRAGGRKFDRAEALAHWNRTDDRAKLFRAAILAHSEDA